MSFLAALEATTTFCGPGLGRRASDGGSVDFGVVHGIDGGPHLVVATHLHKGESVAVPVDDVDIDHLSMRSELALEVALGDLLGEAAHIDLRLFFGQFLSGRRWPVPGARWRAGPFFCRSSFSLGGTTSTVAWTSRHWKQNEIIWFSPATSIFRKYIKVGSAKSILYISVGDEINKHHRVHRSVPKYSKIIIEGFLNYYVRNIFRNNKASQRNPWVKRGLRLKIRR
jgi:hypothetical protein